MRPTPARRRPSRRGVAAVEFAAVLPLLMTVLVGLWDVGRLVQSQQLLSNAAREAARQAATGKQAVPAIQQAALNYLANAGVATTGAQVTFTNLTNPSQTDPTAAAQLDKLQVVVTLPTSNVRWALINQIGEPAQLTGTATWASMNNIPLIVATTIPVN